MIETPFANRWRITGRMQCSTAKKCDMSAMAVPIKTDSVILIITVGEAWSQYPKQEEHRDQGAAGNEPGLQPVMPCGKCHRVAPRPRRVFGIRDFTLLNLAVGRAGRIAVPTGQSIR